MKDKEFRDKLASMFDIPKDMLDVEPLDVDPHVSYHEAQRRELLAFVQAIGQTEITIWTRDGEEVGTLSLADAATLVHIFEEARRIAQWYTPR